MANNKLYFQFAIENVKKTLDAQKGEIEKWAKENPILLEVRFKNLKSQLDALGAVFGKNNPQLVSLGKEVERTFENARKGAKSTVQDMGKMTTAAQELAETNERLAGNVNAYNAALEKESSLMYRIASEEERIAAMKAKVAKMMKEPDHWKQASPGDKISFSHDGIDYTPVYDTQGIKSYNQEIQEAVQNVKDLKSQLNSLADVKKKIANQIVKETGNKERLQELTQRVTTQQNYNSILADTEKLLQRINAAIKAGGNRGVLDVAARDISAFQNKAASLAKYKDEASVVANLSGEYRRLNKVYGSVVKEQESLIRSTQSNTAALSAQSQVLSDLRSMAYQYVSVWAAKSFIDNLIEQGGQLEQQRLSIGAILQDTAHANELFGKIKSLAIISPFGVTELDAMTKQLSAYGFKYNELYDMTRRLADISAATGTEVSRLALALGHVRSEGALSGYTLRQFSMGNIPLLEKLSEKIGVTAKEIRKMVSKKEIGYDQVLEVMKELTNEGGMFYNAQETMSQALNAKFKNLRDSFQIMYSEMAEGAPGDFLKGVAETLTAMSKNWRILMPMIVAGAGTLGVWKATTMALNHELNRQQMYLGKNAIATSKYSMAQLRAIATTGRWTLALRGLGASLMSLGRFVFSPVTLGFAAVESLIYLWQKHNQEVEKAKELTNSFGLTGSEGERNLTERIAGIDPYKKGMSESELKQGIDAMTQALKDYGQGLNVGKMLNEAFGSDANGKVKSLAEQYEYLRGKMEDTLDVYKELQRTADSFEFGINYSSAWWGDENVETDLTDYANAVKKFEDAVTSLSASHKNETKAAVEAAQKQSEAYREATRDMKSYSDMLRELYENREKYGKALGYARGVFAENGLTYDEGQVYGSYYKIQAQKNEAMSELNKFMDGVEEKLGYDMKDLSEKQVSNLLKQTHDWIDKHPEWNNIIDVIKKKIEVRWPIKLEPDAADTPKELNDWQKQMQDWLDKRGSKLKIKPGMTRDDIIKMVHQSIKDSQEVVDQTKPILLRFGVDLSNIPEKLPIGLRTPWGKKQAADYPVAAKENQINKNFIKEFGLPSPKENGSGRKEDRVLKEAKTRLDEAKAFLSEYKKYRQTYGKERSISILEELFPTTKGKGQRIVDDYKAILEQIKKSLKLNTEDRKKFGIDIDKLIADTNLSEAKEKIDRQLRAMEDYISESVEKYDLFKSLFEKTGNADFAMAAFSDSQMWDDAATSLANILREKMGEKGGVLNWDADKKSAEDWFKKNFENGEELYKMWEKIVDLIRGNYKDALTSAAESMKDAMTYEEQKEAIRARYAEKNKNALNDTQRYANQKKEAEELARVDLERLKDEINWDAVFGNLGTYTKKTLIDARKAIQEFVKLNRKNMSVEELKNTADAVNKLNEAIADKSGLFGGFADNIKLYQKAVEDLTEAENDYRRAVKQYGENSIQAQDAKIKVNQAKQGVNNVEKETRQQTKINLNIISTIAQSLAALGKEGGASLSEVGSTISNLISTLNEGNTGIGNLIAAIFSLLDALGTDGKAFGQNLIRSIGNGLYGLNDWNPVGNAAREIFGDHTLVGKFFAADVLNGGNDKDYQDLKDSYESLLSVWDQLISKKKEYLNESWGTESSNAGKEAIRLLQSEIEVTRTLAKERLRAGSSTWSRSYGRRMWEDEWRSVSSEISKSLGVAFGNMDDMVDMSAEQLQWIMEHYPDLWAKMNTEFRGHLEDIIKYGDEVKDTLDSIDEKLNGLSLSGLVDSYYNFVTAGEDANDVLANDLESKLKGAIVKGMIENLYQDRINALLEKATNLGKNDTYIDTNGNVRKHTYDANGNIIDKNVASEYTGDEYRVLTDIANKIGEDSDNTYKILKELYGWNDDESSSSSMSNNIKGVTEQTADLVASYLNAIRADVSVIRQLNSKAVMDYWPEHIRMITSGTESLRNIENHTAAIMRSNDAIEKSNEEVRSILRRVTQGGDRIRIA